MTSIKLNDRGIEVKKLQLLLNVLVKPGPRLKIDGHFGKRTVDAVMAFQKSKKLVADGVVGPKTRVALGLKPQVIVMPPIVAISAPWLDIAAAELGVHENAMAGKHNARILEYHKTTTLKATTDETPWCSSFVNWVMIQSGKKGTNNALAKSWLNWGASVLKPTPGTIVVIKKVKPGSSAETDSSTGYHVGFFLSSTPTSIQILGGNQLDRVKKSNYMLRSFEVKAYRKPL